jgi:hypothetical protein
MTVWALGAGLLLATPIARAETTTVPLSVLLDTQGAARMSAKPRLEGLRLAQADSEDPPKPEPPPPPPDPKKLREEERLRKRQHRAETPAYKQWWFWALGAVVVGTVTGVAIWRLNDESAPPAARGCPADSLACFGDGR